ncbi:Tautomerase-3 domain-containing protein [Aphelenchoides besseyi]|nr:Tautomerase-3 domain-containing protein [Aphelenchoides besseyi]
MPLHRIFHTPGTFNQAHKDELAKRISDLYASFGLPPFYVVVLFIPVEKTDFCVDRKQNIKKFIRTGIQHIARHLSTFAHVQLFFAKYEVVLALFIKNCGLEYEVASTSVIRTCGANWDSFFQFRAATLKRSGIF